MKTLKREVPLSLSGTQHTVDILLGLAEKTHRPIILLASSRPEDYPGERAWISEPLAVASLPSPEEYIQHLPQHYFVAKTWAENSKLWETLLELEHPAGGSLFLHTSHKVTVSGRTAPIMKLGPQAFHAYQEELYSFNHSGAHHGKTRP